MSSPTRASTTQAYQRAKRIKSCLNFLFPSVVGFFLFSFSCYCPILFPSDAMHINSRRRQVRKQFLLHLAACEPAWCDRCLMLLHGLGPFLVGAFLLGTKLGARKKHPRNSLGWAARYVCPAAIFIWSHPWENSPFSAIRSSYKITA